MDSITSTDSCMELKASQENVLLEMIKEICSEDKLSGKLSGKLKGKVTRIISDCDLTHHTSLHKLSTADDSTSTLLGESSDFSLTLISTIINILNKSHL